MPVTKTGRIARKNVRIAFQKNEVQYDQYKNRVQSWEDFFICSAYASTYTVNETGEEVVSEERSIVFETRWCPELESVTSTDFRVIFCDDPYDIVSVDAMNYQKQSIRFTCRKEKR